MPVRNRKMHKVKAFICGLLPKEWEILANRPVCLKPGESAGLSGKTDMDKCGYAKRKMDILPGQKPLETRKKQGSGAVADFGLFVQQAESKR